MGSKRPKGKAKASATPAEPCSCCGCVEGAGHGVPALSGSMTAPSAGYGAASKCGHPPLAAAQHRRLSAALADLFLETFRTSLIRCHTILIGVTYESIAYGFIKRALTQDKWTPAMLRTWLDDDVNVKLFKEHARDALKAAYKDLSNMVLGSTLDGVYERLADLVESAEEDPPSGPIACSCALFGHIDTLDEFVASLREHLDEDVDRNTAPGRHAAPVGPLKTWVLEQHAAGKLKSAPLERGELAEQPGWQGWSKRALPATLKRMDRAFSEALVDYKLFDPLRAPSAAAYLESLRDVDGLRLYTLSALRYELALAARVPLPSLDKGKGKGKAKEVNGSAASTSSAPDIGTSASSSNSDVAAPPPALPHAPTLEASVALQLSAKGASGEALWQQLGATVGGLVNALPPLTSALKSAAATLGDSSPTIANGKGKAASSSARWSSLLNGATTAELSATMVFDARVARQTAREAYDAGDYEIALRHSTDAISLDPDEPAHYLHRARCLLRLDRPAAAEMDCSTALKLDPANYKALLRRGLARRAKGDDEEGALADFEAALAMQPENDEARAELDKLKEVLRRLAVESKK